MMLICTSCVWYSLVGSAISIIHVGLWPTVNDTHTYIINIHVHTHTHIHITHYIQYACVRLHTNRAHTQSTHTHTHAHTHTHTCARTRTHTCRCTHRAHTQIDTNRTHIHTYSTHTYIQRSNDMIIISHVFTDHMNSWMSLTSILIITQRSLATLNQMLISKKAT